MINIFLSSTNIDSSDNSTIDTQFARIIIFNRSFIIEYTMIAFVILSSVIISITTAQQNLTSRAITPCVTNFDCIHGQCDRNRTIPTCVCERGWTMALDGSNQCTYQQKSKLAAFLLSFFVGGLGADWFYLSVGNGGYIAAGVFKLLTLGGLGIWWLVDWIRVLVYSNGVHDSFLNHQQKKNFFRLYLV